MTGGRFEPGKLPEYVERQISQRALERQMYRSRCEIDRAVAFNGLKFDIVDDVCGRMAADLSVYIWAEKLQDETVELKIETPATWWQHFKQAVTAYRRCPKWLSRLVTKRCPVRLKMISQRHTFKTLALFPTFKYEAPPQCGPELIISTLERR